MTTTDTTDTMIARIHTAEESATAEGRQSLGVVLAYGGDDSRVCVVAQVRRTGGWFLPEIGGAPRVERVVYAVLDDESHQSTHDTLDAAVAAATLRAGSGMNAR